MISKVCFRFVPSRVDGLRDVSEAAIYPDRIELRSAGQWVSFRFTDFARWPRPAWLWRFLSRIGWRPRWLPVADRDWRFIAFYTTPPVTVGLPADEPTGGYEETYVARIQRVICAGGFNTFDLG